MRNLKSLIFLVPFLITVSSADFKIGKTRPGLWDYEIWTKGPKGPKGPKGATGAMGAKPFKQQLCVTENSDLTSGMLAGSNQTKPDCKVPEQRVTAGRLIFKNECKLHADKELGLEGETILLTGSMSGDFDLNVDAEVTTKISWPKGSAQPPIEQTALIKARYIGPCPKK